VIGNQMEVHIGLVVVDINGIHLKQLDVVLIAKSFGRILNALGLNLREVAVSGQLILIGIVI
jgi:hypothetical protein